MRLLFLLVILISLGCFSTETLVRVTTPRHSIANSTDFANSTDLEHDLAEFDDDALDDHDDNVDSSEDVEHNDRAHSDEAADNNSDISDEQNDVELDPVTKIPDAIIASHINATFGNKKTFACPRVKNDLLTGTSVGDLSPEDITFIASMGDGVPSGVGLFDKKMDVEFRGASFASGGDANMDGLVTIPNILREFAGGIYGTAHGMGDVDSDSTKKQLSVARKGAFTRDLPAQARELLDRFSNIYGHQRDKWIIIIIAIGTEELCSTCSTPDERAIGEALQLLHSSLNKALVILLGPTHVSHQAKQRKNLLKYRCACSKDKEPGFMEKKAEEWTKVFMRFQAEYDEKMTAKQTFGLLALPQLTVTSRTPDLLFHPGTPIINRRGHTYMSKWLWNRLMTGERYNLSSAVLSQDSYFCPSSGCPYFRTTANMRRCAMLPLVDSGDYMQIMSDKGIMRKQPRRTVRTLYSIAVAVVAICFVVALVVGIIIYNISKRSVRGRFDEVPETVASPDPPKTPTSEPEPIHRKNALERMSTSRRTLDVPTPVYGMSAKKSPERSESMQLLTEP